MCVCPGHRGVRLYGAWGCQGQAARSKWVLGVWVFIRSGRVGAGSPSPGVCLVVGVTLSWVHGSCPSSRRAPYVAAGYGGAPSRARRRWRRELEPGRLLHWQHRVPVASGVKWPQRPRAPSGPCPGSDPPHRTAAPGVAAGPVATGGRGNGEAGPGSVPAGPRSHNGDAGQRKMAAGGRGRPRCPRAVQCACALRAVAGRMRTPPRASSCRAAREAPCSHHRRVRRGHQCPPAALRRAGQRRRPGRRFTSGECPAGEGALRAAPEVEPKLQVT